jgi:hypothetical protein
VYSDVHAVVNNCSVFFPGLLLVVGSHLCDFSCDEGYPPRLILFYILLLIKPFVE